MNNEDFIRIIGEYASYEDQKNSPKSGFTIENSDGSSSVIEVKQGKTNLIFFINSKLYELFGKTFLGTKTGVLSFDATSSTMGFLEDGSSTVSVMKIRKRTLQWLLCSKVFENSPRPCDDGDLEIALQNESYLNLRKRPRRIHKTFTNASDRTNVLAIKYFGIKSAIDHSDKDFFVNRLYLPK